MGGAPCRRDPAPRAAQPRPPRWAELDRGGRGPTRAAPGEGRTEARSLFSAHSSAAKWQTSPLPGPACRQALPPPTPSPAVDQGAGGPHRGGRRPTRCRAPGCSQSAPHIRTSCSRAEPARCRLPRTFAHALPWAGSAHSSSSLQLPYQPSASGKPSLLHLLNTPALKSWGGGTGAYMRQRRSLDGWGRGVGRAALPGMELPPNLHPEAVRILFQNQVPAPQDHVAHSEPLREE